MLLVVVAAGCPASSADHHQAADAAAAAWDGSFEIRPLAMDLSPDAPLAYCDVVQTTYGPVRGVKQAASCKYLGIPFARPPVGALRWRSPQPPEPWTEVLDASRWGYPCEQAELSIGAKSEDCLTLNVWAPNPRPEKPAPVIVWIHKGEGFKMGRSKQIWTEGTKLAEMTGSVVVSMNYRLSALGFLAHPALEPDSGNYGIRDQQAALRWVQDNIAAMGGDPQQVAIMGGATQGSQSVCVHLVSPASAGLFQRAIISSGNCLDRLAPGGQPQVLSQEDAAAQGEKLAEVMRCGDAEDVAACLRAQRAAALQDALAAVNLVNGKGEAMWGPIIDGEVLPAPPHELLEAGVVNDAELVIGTNADEGVGWVGAYRDISEVLYSMALNQQFGAYASELLELYPPSAYSPPEGSALTPSALALGDLLGDGLWVCPSRRAARDAAAAGVPTYLYHLTYPFTLIPYGSETVEPAHASCHGCFKIYVFHTEMPVPKIGSPMSKFTDEERELSLQIMGYWRRFAATGDPNGDEAVSWARYSETSDEHLELAAKIQVKRHLKRAKCDLWDEMTP